MIKANLKNIIMAAVLICLASAVLVISIKGQAKSGELSGIVTRKFTDCSGGEEMDRQGSITPIRQVSCDGGSTITVDYNKTLITATGMTAPGYAYAVDVSTIKVGDKVLVRYTMDNEGGMSLNCKKCGVTPQN